MAVVKVQKDEPFEVALRKFKKACMKQGIVQELRKREYYEKPSIKRRRKAEEARRKALRDWK